MFDIFDLFNNSDFFPVNSSYRGINRCPLCNMSYIDFRNSGKLGCSECYNAFRGPLSDVLHQIHRNSVHVGKIPGNLKAALSRKQVIDGLKKKLQAAVRDENYEEAAKLHKEIVELEKG